MSRRQRPTITDLVIVPKKQSKSQNNSSNSKGKTRPRKKAKARRVNYEGTMAIRENIAPVAMGSSFMNMGKTSSKFRICKTELIGLLASSGSGTFNVINRLRINPASFGTFNWLSKIAPNFESYKFHRCRLIAITRAPTTASGSLIMSPDYDAADGNLPITEQYLFNNQGSSESPVWKANQQLVLSPQMMNRLYKAHVNLTDDRFATTSQDQKTIDVAQVYICTDTNYVGTFGKLLIEYDVEFFQPQAVTEASNQGGMQMAFNTNNNASLPLYSVGQNVIQENNPLLINLPGSSLNNNGSNTTASFGQFSRPYTGPVTLQVTGAGLATSAGTQAELWLSPNSVGGATGVTDIQQIYSNYLTNLTSTNNIVTFFVNAAAGQWLKMIGPTFSSYSFIRGIMGGSAAPFGVNV